MSVEDRLAALEKWASSFQDFLPPPTLPQSDLLPPTHLSTHFKKAEFSCSCCNELPADKFPPQQLLDWLEIIRDEFDSPVIINSGYRCPTHNRNCGGAKHSQHLAGRATDIVVKGVEPHVVYAFCDALVGDKGGVGKYGTFTHIDCRGSKARW